MPATFDKYDGGIYCTMPAASALPVEVASATPIYLRVSTNGQQFSRDSHAFNYFDNSTHVMHRLQPASGPTDGGTNITLQLTGLNESFAAPIRRDGRAACLFNDTASAATIAVDGRSLHCMTPPNQDAGEATIDVTLNGQQKLVPSVDTRDNSLAYGGSSPVLFHFYTLPTLRMLEPLAGPHVRGNSISVHLSPPVPLAAASGVLCSFGEKSTLGALLPPDSPLHLKAAGVVYAPRELRPIARHPSVPHVREELSVYDGSHLVDRFIEAGLPVNMVDGVQYDASPIDAESTDADPTLRGAPSQYRPEGHRYALEDFIHHQTNFPDTGRVSWLAASTVLQWYHNGKATCVGYGPPDDYCNHSQVVCTGEEESNYPGHYSYGNYPRQAKAAVRAIMAAGGVHPDCPSLHLFEAEAAAWPHSGAGNWHHSTLIDRGLIPARTPLEATFAWRTHIATANASIVNCTVPNSTEADAVWEMSTDFECDTPVACSELAVSAGLRLVGNAAVHKGQLRLTRAGNPSLSSSAVGFENRLQAVLPGAKDALWPDTIFEAGATFMTLPPGTHMLQLRVDFSVIIGGGSSGGGEGFAVSYGGDLPEQMGEFGGGLGLRVQFRHSQGADPVVDVVYDGVLIGSSPCPDLRASRPVAVSITAESGGVSITYDGTRLFDRLEWNGRIWAPQPDWQLAFSAACAARPDNHWIDDLRVRTGTKVADTVVPVSIALNGQQFVVADEALAYTYDTSRPPPPPPLPSTPPEPPAPPETPAPPHPPPDVSGDAGSGDGGSGDGSSGDAGELGSGSGTDE